MASRVISIDLVGNNASAKRAIAEVGTSSEKAAAKSTAAFTASTSKIGGAFSKLGSAGAAFGLPFASALDTVGHKLDSTSGKTKNFGSTIAKVGAVEAVAAVAGLVAVGGASISAAQKFEVSQAKLKVAVENTGQSFSSQEEGIKKSDEALLKLGFSGTEAEAALAKLTNATHSVAKAEGLMGLAADVARSQNISLGDATQLLVNVEGGRLKGIGKIIGSTKDASGATLTADAAIKKLTATVGGQGQAYLGTFDGKMAALKATADELEVTIGEALIPKIETLASGTLGAFHAFQTANSATGGFLGKAVAVGAALPVVAFGAEKAAAALGAFTVSEEAAAAGAGVLGTSLSTLGVAALGVGAGLGSFAATQGVLNHFISGNKPAVDQLTTSFKTLAEQNVVDSSATDKLGVSFKKLAGDLRTIKGSTLQKGFGLSESSHQAVKDIDATNEALTNLLKTAGPEKAQLAFNHLAASLFKAGISTKEIGQEFHPFLDSLQQATEAAGQHANATDKDTAAQKRLADAQDALDKANVRLSSAQAKLNADLELSRTSTAGAAGAERRLAGDRAAVAAAGRDATIATDRYADATVKSTSATAKSADQLKREADAAQAVGNRLKALNDDLLASQNSHLALEKAVNDVGAALLDASKAYQENGISSVEARDANLNLRSSLLSAVGAAEADAEATDKARFAKILNATATQKANQEIQIENDKHNAARFVLESLKQQYPQLSAEIDKYRLTLGLIPSQVNTDVNLTIHGGGFHVTGTSIIRHASGGSVPGTGSGDIVPALLEPGEFVMSKKAVNKYGPHAMAALNAGQIPRFAGGGPVGRTFSAGTVRPIVINIQGDVYGEQDFIEKVVKGLGKRSERNGSVAGVVF